MSRHKNAWQILRQMLAEQDRFYLYGPSGQPPLRPPQGLVKALEEEAQQAIRGKEASLLIIDEIAMITTAQMHGFQPDDRVQIIYGRRHGKSIIRRVAQVMRHTMTIEPEDMRTMNEIRDLPKQKNRGPQGHVENWKRRGRKGK